MARFPINKHLCKSLSFYRYQSDMAALPSGCHTTINRALMRRWCSQVDTSRGKTHCSAILSFDLSLSVKIWLSEHGQSFEAGSQMEKETSLSGQKSFRHMFVLLQSFTVHAALYVFIMLSV